MDRVGEMDRVLRSVGYASALLIRELEERMELLQRKQNHSSGLDDTAHDGRSESSALPLSHRKATLVYAQKQREDSKSSTPLSDSNEQGARVANGSQHSIHLSHSVHETLSTAPTSASHSRSNLSEIAAMHRIIGSRTSSSHLNDCNKETNEAAAYTVRTPLSGIGRQSRAQDWETLQLALNR